MPTKGKNQQSDMNSNTNQQNQQQNRNQNAIPGQNINQPQKKTTSGK